MQTPNGLSPTLIALLEMPFTASEHAWVSGKGVYIRKSAIRRRLDLVDPNWTISEPQLLTLTQHVAVLSAFLTIAGVSRGGLGTGVIGAMDSDFKQAAEVSKAFKAAASDCLPRAAMQFGVGTYLQELSREQKANATALQRWLDQQAGTAGGTSPRRSWLDNPGAAEAFERRLQTVGMGPGNATIAHAEKLLGRPLAEISGSDAALKAVSQAWRELRELEPA